jgi:hypothetical protein
MGVQSSLKYWEQMEIPNLGWITKLNQHISGRMVCGGDTTGIWVKEPTDPKWTNLCTYEILGAGYLYDSNCDGIYDAVVAPSDQNIIYGITNSKFYKFVKSGATWTATEGASTTLNSPHAKDFTSNTLHRFKLKLIAVDPRNSQHVVVGTENNGLFESMNGGLSFTLIASLPLPHANSATDAGTRPGCTCIAFDENSAAAGDGTTSVLYAFSQGNGLYRRTGSAFSAFGAALTGLPANNTKVGDDIAIDASGNVYLSSRVSWDLDPTVSAANASIIYKTTRTVTALASFYAPPLTGLGSISIHPADPNRIICQTGGKIIHETNTALAATPTWFVTDWNSTAFASPGQPAIANRVAIKYLVGNGMTWSKVPGENRIWHNNGLGVSYTDRTVAQFGTPVTWTFDSAGMQQLVCREIVCSPDGSLYGAVWDVYAVVLKKPNGSYSPRKILSKVIDNGSDVAIRDAGLIDIQTGNPNRIDISLNRLFGAPQFRSSIYSPATDVLTPIPVSGIYATDSVTPSPNTNAILRKPVNTGNGGYTGEYADGGSFLPMGTNEAMHISRIGPVVRTTDLSVANPTWTEMQFPGTDNAMGTGLGTPASPYAELANGWKEFYYNYYLGRRMFCLDTVNPNLAYACHGMMGHYRFDRTAAAGAGAWTRVRNTLIETHKDHNYKLRGIPGIEGGIGLCTGGTTGEGSSERLQISIDGGANWTAFGLSDDVREVVDFGFGKGAPGKNYVALYFIGIVANVFGHWQCDDWKSVNPTIKKIGDRYIKELARSNCICGDLQNYGHVYIGKGGAGFYWTHGGQPIENGYIKLKAA